jgi:16S rRNA (cytosine967-C5)-methyltransferase
MNDISFLGNPIHMGSFKKKNPRAISLEILNQVGRTDRHPDDLLNDSFKRYRHLNALDRAFLTELVYGVLRWRGKLDWVICYFSRIPFEKIETEIVNILRLGLYQLLFLTRTPASAAVNESVELAKGVSGKGGPGFVNAMLRSTLREKDGIPYPDIYQNTGLSISVTQSHPLWLVQRWIKEMGVKETLKICTFNNRIPPLTLRANTLKIRRADLMEKLRESKLNPSPCSFSEEGILLRDPPPASDLPFLEEGFYAIQDEASQLVTAILDPKPGERILDACAAPGGKTTHMAQRMENAGEIYAFDLKEEKLNLIKEACRRLGMKIIKTLKGNAANPLPIPKGLEFDRALADVPCSGFGTLRRNPDLKWRRTDGDLARLRELQFSILDHISTYIRKGGILVYSTCTVFHEENEDVVESFLKGHPEFHLDRIEEIQKEKNFLLVKNRYFKTFPPPDEMDGFFMARLRRES